MKKVELRIAKRLAIKEFGITEFILPNGRIDVLTAEEIIEVKKASAWKHALGQVLSYKAYFPSQQARIHLFGTSNYSRGIIENACHPLNVRVTWESEVTLNLLD